MTMRPDTSDQLTSDSQLTDKKSVRMALRKSRAERRDRTTTTERDQHGLRACEHLLEHPALVAARCVATYEPLPTEEDVSALSTLLDDKVRFLVPITLEDRDLSWRDAHSGEDLGKEGIAQADVIVVPALAIGSAGERLGQGGGSYDRALPRRRAGVPVIAVVFPDEVGRDFTTEAHDEAVDAVTTCEGITIF